MYIGVFSFRVFISPTLINALAINSVAIKVDVESLKLPISEAKSAHTTLPT